MSEPKGRGAAWTEERGTSDEGRQRLKSAPEASGEQSTSDEGPPPQAAKPAGRCLESAPEASGEYCITCSDTAVEVTVLRLLADEMAVVEGGAGEETVSVALVTADVGDTILVHAREAIAVIGR